MAFSGLLTGTEQSSAGESGCEDGSLDAPRVRDAADPFGILFLAAFAQGNGPI